MGDNKEADKDLQFDVDLMILDYLIFDAIKTLLTARQAERSGNMEQPPALYDQFNMVDAFLTIFKTNHPGSSSPLDAVLVFRLELLKFAALYTRRFHKCEYTPDVESLEAVRRANAHSATRRNRDSGLPPVPKPFTEAYLSMCRDRPLEEVYSARHSTPAKLGVRWSPAEEQSEMSDDDPHLQQRHYGHPELVSLRDLVPMFVSLTASRIATSGGESEDHVPDEAWTITEAWMCLAADLMAQSCLEHWLLSFDTETDLVDEVFAWGGHVNQEDSQAHVDNDLMSMDDASQPSDAAPDPSHALFASDPVAHDTWLTIRNSYVVALTTIGEDMDFREHCQFLENEFSPDEFEENMLSFLESLLLSHEAPVLVQLERGQLRGLTDEEVLDLKRHVGWVDG